MYRVFFFEIINNAKKTLKQSKENENEYKSDLNEIKTAKKKKKKKNAIYNIETLYKAQNIVIKIFDNFSSFASNSRYKATHGEWLKILSHKQMLQRLPISLMQVQTISTSENLLNKIRQLIYSLYQAKKITKKAYNNIMNLINS